MQHMQMGATSNKSKQERHRRISPLNVTRCPDMQNEKTFHRRRWLGWLETPPLYRPVPLRPATGNQEQPLGTNLVLCTSTRGPNRLLQLAVSKLPLQHTNMFVTSGLFAGPAVQQGFHSETKDKNTIQWNGSLSPSMGPLLPHGPTTCKTHGTTLKC